MQVAIWDAIGPIGATPETRKFKTKEITTQKFRNSSTYLLILCNLWKLHN
jgi:hypothetical protein